MPSESSHVLRVFKSRALAGALWLVGCANLIGVEDGRAQNECSSKLQCAPGYDCLLGICRNDCTGDEQCGAGARCLKAIGTSACIPGAEGCGDSCPDGTSCEGGVCRTQCSSADQCAGGQACQLGLCVGIDVAHDMPQASGGSAGMSSGGSAGSAGKPPVDVGGSGGRGDAIAGSDNSGNAAGEGGSPPGNDAGAGGEPNPPVKACSPRCKGSTPLCNDGVCVAPPSCTGAPSICGPQAASKCCEQSALPAGSVLRSYDGVSVDALNDQNPANVSEFSLDLLEVTVGRFRRFVNAGGGVITTAPEMGAGAVPGNVESGWKSDYTNELVANKNALVTALHCHEFATWTNTADTVGSGEARPIDCVTWYEAQAFCIWDGGRLPTEAEWNYAAAGGQQRVYPWSVPANNASISCAQASLYLNDTVKCCAFDEKPAAQSCTSADIVVAGSKSGKGYWEQRDLGGNVQEWVSDYYAPNYDNPCDDCVQTSKSAYRVIRGGGYFSGPSGLTASARDVKEPFSRAPDIGFRCAYGH